MAYSWLLLPYSWIPHGLPIDYSWVTRRLPTSYNLPAIDMSTHKVKSELSWFTQQEMVSDNKNYSSSSNLHDLLAKTSPYKPSPTIPHTTKPPTYQETIPHSNSRSHLIPKQPTNLLRNSHNPLLSQPPPNNLHRNGSPMISLSII